MRTIFTIAHPFSVADRPTLRGRFTILFLPSINPKDRKALTHIFRPQGSEAVCYSLLQDCHRHYSSKTLIIRTCRLEETAIAPTTVLLEASVARGRAKVDLPAVSLRHGARIQMASLWRSPICLIRRLYETCLK
jgi:hypothetical protein